MTSVGNAATSFSSLEYSLATLSGLFRGTTHSYGMIILYICYLRQVGGGNNRRLAEKFTDAVDKISTFLLGYGN